MPAVFQKTVEQDLHKPLKIQYCADTVFTKDNAGNQINVLLFEDGEPYSSGGTVSATAIRADGATESWAGTISGNTVSVALTRAALDVPGTLQVFIKVTAGTTETTVYAGVYNVVCTETPTVVAPVTPSDVAALIASIEAAIRNIPADWTSFLGTIAPTFDPGKTGGYAAGAYVWYPGQPDNVGTLYRFTSAHSGTWTGTDAVTVVIGNELNDTVRYTQQIHTDAEKTIARANIGAADADDVVDLELTTVQVTPQTFDDNSKSQARSNIGAASSGDLNTLSTLVNNQGGYISDLNATIGTVPAGETVEGQIGDLRSAIDVLEPTATAEDVGKTLVAKTVTNGKVSEYEFGTAGEGLTEEAKVALLNCFAHVAWIDEHGQDYYGALVSALYPNEYPKIIAIYNPGSFVPTSGDPLSVLIPYLRVVYYETAESSGTTISSSNYTLSGSLSTAQSSITVQYLTCLTSFTVNVDVWDYVWNTTSGVLPTGMTADSYDFTTEAGILHVFNPILDFEYFGDAEIEVEGKFPQVNWASHPQVCIVSEYPSDNSNNHATLNAICGNRENYNIYVKGVFDGSTYGWIDTGLIQNQYRKFYIKVENGVSTIRVDNNEYTTTPYRDWIKNTHFCTGIFSEDSAQVMFIKSIKFRRL